MSEMVREMHFWVDVWCGEIALKDVFHSLLFGI